ncbi:MAG TPA: hypothetical protein V6C81_25220 [Planktothrix sp.]|jgi:hypothetical protein
MLVRIFSVVAIIVVSLLSMPAHSMVLKGGVEHSDRVDPVPDDLAPGQVFDRRNLPMNPDPAHTNQWYKIPDWLAGTWHKESQTDFYRFDYSTHQTDVSTRVQEARSNGVWGTQKDDQGQVWQFDPGPYVTTVDAGTQTVVEYVKSNEPVECSDRQFVSRSFDTQIRIEKATNEIKSVQSGEHINTYVPEGDGLIKRETSAKVFNRYGMPVLLGKSFSYEQQIGPFVAQDNYNGSDMRALLRQFLAKNREAMAGTPR